jgi:hypothetical protein
MFPNYKITRLPNYKFIPERVHGKYNKTQQRRSEENKAHRPQETQGGKAAQAPRLSSRIEEAEGQEIGPRPGEAVKAALARALSFQSITENPHPTKNA